MSSSRAKREGLLVFGAGGGGGGARGLEWELIIKETGALVLEKNG